MVRKKIKKFSKKNYNIMLQKEVRSSLMSLFICCNILYCSKYVK